jgi:outer membrane receptor for ferric coprogen and ferric-rhodotorulic acid
VTLDAMAKYRVNEHVSLQINVINLADRFYFDNSRNG